MRRKKLDNIRASATLTTALFLTSIFPPLAAKAQDNRWLTMGKTNSGDTLSLNINSVQIRPNTGNAVWFAYAITDNQETRTNVAFTNSCSQGKLTGKAEWYAGITDKNGSLTKIIIVKADSVGSLALLRRVCQAGYTSPISSNPVKPSPPKIQEICRKAEPPAPSDTRKTVELKQFGIRIKIPSNYRTMLLNDGAVEIIDQAGYEVFSCLARGGKVLDPSGYSSFRIRLVANPQNLSLSSFAQKKSDSNSKIYTYNLTGINVLIVENGMSTNAWFIVPGINGVVEMEEACDCDTPKDGVVMQLDNTEIISNITKP